MLQAVHGVLGDVLVGHSHHAHIRLLQQGVHRDEGGQGTRGTVYLGILRLLRLLSNAKAPYVSNRSLFEIGPMGNLGDKTVENV